MNKAKKYLDVVAEDECAEFNNLRRMLVSHQISKEEFKNGIIALAAMGKIPRNRVNTLKNMYQ